MTCSLETVHLGQLKGDSVSEILQGPLGPTCGFRTGVRFRNGVQEKGVDCMRNKRNNRLGQMADTIIKKN